jgi:nucleoside-diphosphate-sugar epimerase
MKKPLVALTGGTGFIGQHLLRELAKRGFRLRVLLRRPTKIPLDCASAVVGDLMRPQNMSAALADVDAVIHTAGPSHVMSGLPEDDHRLIGTDATVSLARAAQHAGVRRFIFLSSVRAQSGATAEAALHEGQDPQPTDAYGRSKLAAERGLAGLDIDWVALRLVTVYGPGMTGNLARLTQIARSPYPLPLGAVATRRSLLSVDNLASAIAHVLALSEPLRRPLIVADPQSLTLAQIIAAMRRGLGRYPALFPVPTPLLRLGLQAAGQAENWPLVTGSLVAEPVALMALGWKPEVTTAQGLEQLMRTAPPQAAPAAATVRPA